MFTASRASGLCHALQIFRAVRSLFTTVFAETRAKVSHTYARSLLKVALEMFPASLKIQTLTKMDIPASRIRVAAACGRIKFTPELYEQFKKVGKDGHMELAEAWPEEFVQACKTNDWKMLHKDLTRIFAGSRFSDGQKMDMLQLYEGALSDATVAKAAVAFLTKKNYKKLSEAALANVFPHVVQSDLQVLILQRLNPDLDKIKAMISVMKEPYNKVLDANGLEKLPTTALSKSLKRFLIGKGVIVDVKVDVAQRGDRNE